MRFYLFNLKKDKKIIIKNSLALTILMVVILQIYGSYFYRFEYQEKKFIEDRGFIYQIENLNIDKVNEIININSVDRILIDYNLSDMKFNEKSLKDYIYKNIPIRLISLSKIDGKVLQTGKSLEIDDERKEIIVPNNFLFTYKKSIGDEIELNGKKLSISGTTTSAYDSPFIISINIAKDLGIKKAQYNVIPKRGLSKIEFENLIKKADQIFDEKASMTDYSGETGNDSDRILPVLVLIMIISSFNLVLIYNYFLGLRKGRRLIYRMDGADRKLLIKSQLVEIMLIFIISSVLSFIVIKAVDFILFKSILNIYRFSLPFKNYLLIYAIYFVIYLFAIIFGNRKILKKGLVG